MLAGARLPGSAGRAFAEVAKQSFVDGFHAGLLVAALATAAGVVAVLAFLPARPRAVDVERQAEEFEAERHALAGAALADRVPVSVGRDVHDPSLV